MLIEHSPDHVVLRCSDGYGDPTFDDLVVTLSFRHDMTCCAAGP
jgi:hypothetical protein